MRFSLNFALRYLLNVDARFARNLDQFIGSFKLLHLPCVSVAESCISAERWEFFYLCIDTVY